MKFIFDFDDVLFNTARYREEHFFPTLEKAGVLPSDIDDYFKKTGKKLWSIKDILAYFSINELYDEIMRGSENFKNKKLIEIIKKIGKKNCYIVTHGDEEFQLDKIKRTEIGSLFSEIIVVPEGKKGAVEKICAKHKNEKVIFVDDQAKHFEDLDFKKYPNLKTILYDEKGFEKVMAEIGR